MSGTGTPTSPYTYLTPAGVIVPDTEVLQADVIGEYQAALNAPDLDTDPETPQGGLIVAETNGRAGMVGNNAALANQINPNIAGGVFLQAICALTGLDVPEAAPSIVSGVSVGGDPGTIIPAGSTVPTAAGDNFRTTEQVQLDTNGKGTVDFESVALGPIPCAQGALSRPGPGQVFGWTSVYNSSAATLGKLAPSDVELRQLRNDTLALQGSSLSEAITSAVNVVLGVLPPCQFRQNDEKFDRTIDGIFLKANSIWVCAQGGSDVDVANAMRIAKSGGCAYNGTTTIYITDPASNQLCPVSFDRPTAVPLVCQITVVLPNTTYTSNDVQQALLDYVAGLIKGQAGFTVGAPASPFDMASGVTSEIPGVIVRNLQIGLKVGGGLSPSQINMALNQIATLARSDINVISSTQTS